MNKINNWLVLFLIILLQACSSQDIYELIQDNQLSECQTLPLPQYDECMEQANESYDEYSEKRKEVTGDE